MAARTAPEGLATTVTDQADTRLRNHTEDDRGQGGMRSFLNAAVLFLGVPFGYGGRRRRGSGRCYQPPEEREAS